MHAGEIVADRFELERIAGAGGMGEVWRARDRLTGAEVALKLLQVEATASRERFAREAALLAELLHPAIVRYVAHGATQGGQPFIAMEWLEGNDLGQLLTRGPLPVDATIAVGRRVAEALSTAHAQGVVHRDVKPSNVILVAGRPELAKLVDFGVARTRFTSAQRRVQTRTGAPIGSPGYMAPEQARGDPTVGPAADVFALGCVLYECVTGRPAFAGEHLMAILAKLVLEDPPHASEIAPNVPPELDDLLARMLAKDVDQRPKDGAAVMAELSALRPAPSDRKPETSAKPPALGSDEMRLVSVVLAAGDLSPNALAGPTLTPEQASLSDLQNELDALAMQVGTTFTRLADGTRLAVLIGQGMATDQAARAALAAVGLQRALGTPTPIAVTTGRALVQGRLPVGDAIDRAAKLAAVHEGSAGIHLDSVTAGLLDNRFEIGTGSSGRRLLGVRDRTEPIRTLIGRMTPCIGRDREIAALMDLFDECVEEPIARAVVLTGAAGIGKSRVRHEWMKRLGEAHPDVEVWLGQGEPTGVGSSFALLGRMVRQAAGVALGEDVEIARGKLSARVARNVAASERDRVSEFLGEIAMVRFDEETSPPLRAARADPQLMAEQTLRAWLDFVAGEAASKPLVLVLEDLQWGDLSTVQWVDAALRRLREAPFFVLGVGRAELEQLFPKLWADRGVQTIMLRELGKRATEKLVREVLENRADEKTVARIGEQSAGHPLLAEELMRATLEGREGETPETVLAIVQARLETLPEAARRVLRAASIFGTSFWRGGVVALLGGASRAAEVGEWLKYLVEREVISQRHASRFAGEDEYFFPQALVREAALVMLLDHDRSLGHRLAGQWLADAGERDPVVLAEHFDAGSARERASRWWKKAAEAALVSGDLTAAATRADRALSCGALGEARGELKLIQAEALVVRGSTDEASERCAEAIEHLQNGGASWYIAVADFAVLCQKRGDPRSLDRVTEWLRQEEPHPDADTALARGSALARASAALVYIGKLDDAEILARLAETVMQLHPNDDALVAGVHHAVGVLASARSDWGTVLGEFAASQRAFQRAGNIGRATNALMNVGDAWMNLGRYEDAEKTSREALATAERLGFDTVVRMSLMNVAFSLGRLGRLEEARATAERGIATCASEGDRRIRAYGASYLSDILRHMGDADGAEREARAAIAFAEAHAPMKAYGFALLAAALLAKNDPQAALVAANEAYAIAARLGALGEGDSLLRLVRATALRVRDEKAAREAIREARDLLLAKAERIRDPQHRASFLERVEEHARTLELAKQWLDGFSPA
jgi:tetratricopeptide (TPR) repeat protein